MPVRRPEAGVHGATAAFLGPLICHQLNKCGAPGLWEGLWVPKLLLPGMAQAELGTSVPSNPLGFPGPGLVAGPRAEGTGVCWGGGRAGHLSVGVGHGADAKLSSKQPPPPLPSWWEAQRLVGSRAVHSSVCKRKVRAVALFSIKQKVPRMRLSLWLVCLTLPGTSLGHKKLGQALGWWADPGSAGHPPHLPVPISQSGFFPRRSPCPPILIHSRAPTHH